MCAILGMVGGSGNVLERAIILLNAENNRGEQGAGGAFFDGKETRFYYGKGKVADVFGLRDREKWSQLVGSVCTMQTLYSTIGSKNGVEQPMTQHPIKFNFLGRDGAISHNGNIIRLGELRNKVQESGYTFASMESDSEVVAGLLSTSKKSNFLEALLETLRKIEGKGSFSLVILYEGKIYGVRDQNGNRPLCIIKQSARDGEGDTYILASETSIYPSLAATRLVREVGIGELVVIGKNGIEKSLRWTENINPAYCAKEAVYLLNPASRVFAGPADPLGVSAYSIRKKWGEILAREYSVKGAEVVAGIPNSGLAYADGYALESGVHHQQGFIRTHYSMSPARTFMEPREKMHDRSDRQIRKLQANPDVMAGKVVVATDDSLIRAMVARAAMRMGREHGRAKELHLRVGSPRVCHRCHLGNDIPTLAELVATRLSVEETRAEVCADSLAHLTVEQSKQGLKELGLNPEHFCWGCFTGEYPVPPPEEK